MIMRRKKASQQLEQVRELINQQLLEEIAPVGGAVFYPHYIQKDGGYECTLYVYEFPYDNLILWGDTFKYHNCITFLQCEPLDTKKLQIDLNNALEEYEDRLRNKTIKKIDKQFAVKEIQRLTPLVEMLNNKEEFFRVAIRLVISETTVEKLNERVNEIQDDLKKQGYKATVLLNEQANESRMPFKSLTKEPTYKRYGKEMPSLTFAGAYPFTYTSLKDFGGVHIGYTDEGGQVVFNSFHKTQNRTSFNGCIFGLSGSGKSTFLLKLAKYQMSIGNKLRFIDPVGQSAHLISLMGGEVVSLDGDKDSKILNPLAKTYSLKDDESEIEASLSKAETFMRIIAPALTDHEISLFGNLLKPIYEIKDEPIFSDVLVMVEERLKESDLSNNQRTQLENLQIQLNRIIQNYGRMFNVPSNLNTKDSIGVCYVMRELVQKDSTVYQAQMFNVLSYLWNELIEIGSPQYKLYTKGELALEDVIHYSVMIDEAHHILNANNPYGIKYCSTFMREARKYFGGMLYITHRLKDIVKNGSTSSEDLATLFDMTQYKFIFRENQTAIPLYRQLFDGQFTERELAQIPELKQGEFLLSTVGEPTLKVNSYGMYCDKELEWFGGGV